MSFDEQKLKKAIGVKLQAARKAKHYTQQEVADKVKLTPNYYATLEQGATIASVETFYEIFEVLEVKASEIFPDKV